MQKDLAETIYDTIYQSYTSSLAGIPDHEYQNLVDYLRQGQIAPEFQSEVASWTGKSLKEHMIQEYLEIYQKHKAFCLPQGFL